MPYIDQQSRLKFADYASRAFTAGELNYEITRIIKHFLGDGPNYQKLNEVIGVLECAKLELYRRAVAPYEDRKIAENGDVY